MREWDYRWYSFNSKWVEGEQMASMRNGQGDGWFCGFGLPGAFLKGFDHESKMSPWNMESPKVWTGVLNITLSSTGTTLRVIPGMSSSAGLTFNTAPTYIEFNNLGGLTYPAAALTFTYTQATVTRNLGVCLNGRVVLSGVCS